MFAIADIIDFTAGRDIREIEQNPELGEEFDKLVPPDEYGCQRFSCYGVCDSPEQFIDRFKAALEQDPRTFVVSFAHIPKNPDNEGMGGGWRWHKWGPYIGDGKPQCEYLDDEEGFSDGVYIYHVFQLRPVPEAEKKQN